MNSSQNNFNIEESEDVRAFIDKVCSRIYSKKLKQKTKDEILSHIDALVSEELIKGNDFSLAIKEAITQFGNPKKISKSIQQANLPFYLKKQFLIPILCFCSMLLFFVFAVELYRYDAEARIKLKINKADKNTELFHTKDLKLQNLKLVKSTTTGNDFGKYINSRIPWAKRLSRGYYFKDESKNIISIPEDIATKLDSLNGDKDWIISGQKLDFSRVDFTWINNIRSYDYWDVLPNDLNNTDKNLNIYFPPTPAYKFFSDYSKLILIKGYKKKQLSQAITTVNHLANLLYSNETLLGSMIASSIFSYSHDAAIIGKKHKLLEHDFKMKFTTANLQDMRQVLRSRIDSLNFILKEENLDKNYMQNISNKHAIGYCQSIREGILYTVMTYKYFDGRYPLEKNYNKNINLIDKIITQSKDTCRLTHARHLWANRHNAPSQFELFQGVQEISFNKVENYLLRVSSKIPYLRQVVGKIILTGRPEFKNLFHKYVIIGDRHN